MNRADTAPPDASIDEAFPHKVCINLDRRPERRRRMKDKFEEHGIRAVRMFAALDGESLDIPAHWSHTPGAYGCLRSHLRVVEEARGARLPSVLIFEDDAVFDPDLREKFSAYVRQLPRDWDMLYFGALHKDELVPVSDNVVRLTRSNSTYAYALRDTIFDAFIELNARAVDVLDNNSFILQERFNCYCFIPHLAWVETGYSDAQRRLERHWYLRESLVLFGAGVDRLLAETTVVFAHAARKHSARAAENVLFLAGYYHEFFSPHIEMVVVEQGARPALERAALPPGCKHVFLRDDGPFDRALCFAAGIENSNPDRELFILSDDDIYPETLDIRANLRMCERYDCATGFDELIELTDEDSSRLLDTKTTRGLDVTSYARPAREARPGYYRFATRAALRALYEGEGFDSGDRFLTAARQRGLRAFRSPNHALRLSGG
jgi:GR25 family glycosyltransferase involved in LPS biosynthesis